MPVLHDHFQLRNLRLRAHWGSVPGPAGGVVGSLFGSTAPGSSANMIGAPGSLFGDGNSANYT